jgi:hypothetical protein
MVSKGEITRSRLRREWPHHVALPAEAVRGLANAETVRGFAATLSAVPLTYHLVRENRSYVAFCFATAEAAQLFAERFGGELLPAGETGKKGRR